MDLGFRAQFGMIMLMHAPVLDIQSRGPNMVVSLTEGIKIYCNPHYDPQEGTRDFRKPLHRTATWDFLSL